MPIYEYKCDECDKEWETYSRVEDRNKELCSCGEKALIQVSKPAFRATFNYFDQALDMQITSTEQRKRIIKERGLGEL